MKDKIYYFTGTGNTLNIATKIAKKANMELVPIKKAIDEESIEGSRIGVAFPIYMFNAPKIVYKFFEKIKKCDYIFLIMTMGGCSGKTTKRINKILKKNNLSLSAWFALQMPDNYIVWTDALKKEKQKKLFSIADKRVDDIAFKINKKQENFDKENNFIKTSDENIPFPFSVMPKWMLQALFDLGHKQIPKLDNDFIVDNKCNGCGTCKKICPVGNIEMSNKKPKWNHKCEQCFACLQWCPKEAIQYKDKTSNRKRYQHPEVKVSELLKN